MVDAGVVEQASSSSVHEPRLEILELGSGPTLLFLNAGMGLDPGSAALDLLARHARVIAPSHPGFGRSERPRALTTVEDLSYFYLDFLDERDLRDVTLVGVSFGAWIAAEIAVKSTVRLSRLVLADAVGIKVGDRQTQDIADIFAMTESEFNAAAFANAEVGTLDYKAMSDAEVLAVAQNRESLARFAWSPYMHNPKLRGRLHRINVATLFLWGANDRIVSETYGRSYCARVPNARFELIHEAGHLPQIEQPQVFAQKILGFMGRGIYP